WFPPAATPCIQGSARSGARVLLPFPRSRRFAPPRQDIAGAAKEVFMYTDVHPTSLGREAGDCERPRAVHFQSQQSASAHDIPPLPPKPAGRGEAIRTVQERAFRLPVSHRAIQFL